MSPALTSTRDVRAGCLNRAGVVRKLCTDVL